MAATSQWFGQSAVMLVARQWVPTQMGVILMQPAWNPAAVDTAIRYSDVSSSELPTAGGYTVGGQQITGRTLGTYDASADEIQLNGNDLSWGPGATFTTSYGIIYEMISADKYLWALLNFGGPVAISNGVFQIDWTAGLLSVQCGAPV